MPNSSNTEEETETIKGRKGKGARTLLSPIESWRRLLELRETFSRAPHESVTDYVCRVLDKRADLIVLSLEEVKGYHWGPEVFLGSGPEGDVPLSSRIFHWAGSFDPIDREEPTEVHVSDPDELAEAIRTLACVQAMDQRGLYPHPLDAPIDPQRLKLLVRGLPTSLKVICHAIRVEIERALGSDNQRGNALPHHMTWEELLEKLMAKGRALGYF